MKKFIAIMLVVVMVLGAVPAFATVYYNDVSENAYYYDSVDWAYHNRIVFGYDDGNFYPDLVCNRAQAVTMLQRFAMYKGYPTDIADDADLIFLDVTTRDYYYNAARWAQWNGIVKGVDATHFDPDGMCTRAQIATMLYRMAKFYGIDSYSVVQDGHAKFIFSDVSSDAYYFDAVRWAQCNEIVNGVGNNRFNPNGICTRAQIVTMLYRMDSRC